LKQLAIDPDLSLEEEVGQFLEELMSKIGEQQHNMIELNHCPKEMSLEICSYPDSN